MRFDPHWRSRERTVYLSFGHGPRSNPRCFMPQSERTFYALSSAYCRHGPEMLASWALEIEKQLGLDWWRDHYQQSPHYQREIEQSEADRKRVAEREQAEAHARIQALERRAVELERRERESKQRVLSYTPAPSYSTGWVNGKPPLMPLTEGLEIALRMSGAIK